ncbi:hypothetical protein A1OO_12495 [Enterovibrio norvegicus FF-33]|uniref:ParB/Sulfiredoxin domain-containing protein n=1 Tax=Enterovibrio norvegicus FF-454 TaxID=1185651 RepID=A0A1E5C8G7_9GAMM|nr:hypothetical protein [Enterovibrio norvegicus]OEE61790.1 hypothetical protein A1OK_08510 [Enterovibrio norvegicus FF-454]OEE66587.1 hypothetical protein A1OO_12495 [Enterovibrio norvegicus FF-33]OEE77609.1 hypothetical protein A1OQ_00770 [Enterovibrio norvegicus FF-162]
MELIPVSELVKMDLQWLRGDDARFKSVLKSLKSGDSIKEAIQLIRCACGKTYILQDGGHRISAAFKLFQDTGQDLPIPVSIFQSNIP